MSRTVPEARALAEPTAHDAARRARDAVTTTHGRARLALNVGVALAWLVVPVSIAFVIVFDEMSHDAGRPDLVQDVTEGFVYVLAMVSASTVGAALAARRPRHPVGWLFLALGGVQAVGAALSGYAAYGAIARPGSLPMAAVAGVVSDSGFLLWFVFIALVLHLTPDGRPLSWRWGLLALVTAIGGALAVVTVLLTPTDLDPPLDPIENPIQLTGLADQLGVGRAVLGFVTGAGVLVGGASLLVRFRRARGLERRQLLWLAPAAVLIPILVGMSFVASYTDNFAVLNVVGSLFAVLLPIATALAITRYHLYDIDRILSRALTYVLVSAVLAVVYVVVVISVGAAAGQSQFSAVLATLAAVSVAAPAYRRLQDLVDRRFNRRRFEAVQVVRRHVRNPRPDVDIEQVLRLAVGDPNLRVAYWVDSRSEWVRGDGRPAEPGDGAVELRGHGRRVARIDHDPAKSRQLVEAVVAEARPELDIAGLRAAVALQLVEVQESRARIVSAADASRRHIERDLHDGAQQHLVALAVKLGLARRVAADDPAAVTPMLEELRADVQEALTVLRNLAHGIYPPLLREHGLGEALRNAANRAARPTTVEVRTDRRFSPDVEAAVYFCCLEAMQNAGKHAGESADVTIRLGEEDADVVFEVIDDGVGFDPAEVVNSAGFVNMRDRVGAFGGRLSVESTPGQGTAVRGRLPVTEPAEAT